jgi:hypothetical protein
MLCLCFDQLLPRNLEVEAKACAAKRPTSMTFAQP